MTTSLDTEVLAEVLAALDEVNVTVRFTDPATTVSASESRVTDGTPVVTDVIGTPPLSYESDKIDGENVLRGDTYIVTKPVDTAGSAFAPDTEHKVTFPNSSDGKTWRIVGWSELRPGDNVAAWIIQLRS